jgi:molecular chaperone DnaK (HSP70)
MSEKRVHGIDLGTTYSCVAKVDEYGKAVIIPNSANQLTTPSVVFFESKENIVVGEHARDAAKMDPGRVVSMIKRVMGDADWNFESDGIQYTPQDVSSFVLRKLIDDARANTGETIEDVIITVPAYFGLNERRATEQAGELAGLNVLELIPEPTAAAIHYGLEQHRDEVVLVYDLGGGTFDISVIEIKEGAINVLCVSGDDQLGGKNWDELLAAHFAESFSSETGTAAEDLLQDEETYQELLLAAERVKQALGERESIDERIRFEADRVNVTVTRDDFDRLTQGLLDRTLSLTEELLETARGKGHDRIDKILLVGGSTYMPQVEKALRERFPFEPELFEPNQAVAKGAAIFGLKLSLDEKIRIEIAEQTGQDAEAIDLDEVPDDVLNKAQTEVATKEGMALPAVKKLSETTITNVASKSFGIFVIDRDTNQERVNNLIVLDDPVPATLTRSYTTHGDDQSGVDLRCFENTQREGPDDNIDPALATLIGEVALRFDRSLPADSPIEVTFSLARDGLLSIHGKDRTTGTEVTGEFKTDGILSSEELAEKRARNLTQQVS